MKNEEEGNVLLKESLHICYATPPGQVRAGWRQVWWQSLVWAQMWKILVSEPLVQGEDIFWQGWRLVLQRGLVEYLVYLVICDLFLNLMLMYILCFSFCRFFIRWSENFAVWGSGEEASWTRARNSFCGEKLKLRRGLDASSPTAQAFRQAGSKDVSKEDTDQDFFVAISLLVIVAVAGRGDWGGSLVRALGQWQFHCQDSPSLVYGNIVNLSQGSTVGAMACFGSSAMLSQYCKSLPRFLWV